MARSEAMIKEGAAAFLEEGVNVLAAIVARPRDWTQATASAGRKAEQRSTTGPSAPRRTRHAVHGRRRADEMTQRPAAPGLGCNRDLSGLDPRAEQSNRRRRLR